jgi:galactokinase
VARRIVARAPGRVNLIGDHTDYTGGLVMPMAVDRWTVVEAERWDQPLVHLASEHEQAPAIVPLPVQHPEQAEPPWARYVAGVAAEMGAAAHGVDGRVSGDLPVGSGLSSSAALEVATALALGYQGDPVELAHLCRRAEQRASGVPCGIMDQLASVAGVAGCALLIDCTTLAIEPVPLPADVEVVVRFVAPRMLAASEYALRVAQCAVAEAELGPLRAASIDRLDAVTDPVVRHRAHHVITENARVREFAHALAAGDVTTAGALMTASHASLRDDFEVSTTALDDTVDRLLATPGVLGARLTGGGFGGCVVALALPGSPAEGWRLRPVDGASVAPAQADTTGR